MHMCNMMDPVAIALATAGSMAFITVLFKPQLGEPATRVSDRLGVRGKEVEPLAMHILACIAGPPRGHSIAHVVGSPRRRRGARGHVAYVAQGHVEHPGCYGDLAAPCSCAMRVHDINEDYFDFTNKFGEPEESEKMYQHSIFNNH